MIGRTNTGGGSGGGGKTVLLYGGANEQISYTGTQTGIVTLDANGSGSVILKKGNYTFSANVSGRTSAVTISDDTSVLLRPANAIYWYGVEIVPMTEIKGSGVSSKTITKGTNSISISLNRTGSTNVFTFFTDLPINLDIHSSLCGIYRGVTNGFSRLAYSATDNSRGTGTDSTESVATVTVDISSVSGSYYVGISGGSSRTGVIAATEIFAIWLE